MSKLLTKAKKELSDCLVTTAGMPWGHGEATCLDNGRITKTQVERQESKSNRRG